MLEITLLSLAGWLLLAAASFRFRRQLDIASPATMRGIRIAGATLFATAFLRCGTAIDGERCVRFLGGASLAGAIVVALLSIAPAWTMRPVALLLRVGRPRQAASRPSSIAAGSNAKSSAGSGAS